ncbi:MAG: hypothetical protein CMJ46_11740 [Planctomyces sp.]|nr:hypothetical protein [Planctomyces sp.]
MCPRDFALLPLVAFSLLTLSVSCKPIHAEEAGKQIDLLDVVVKTSDALITHGRDQWGPEQTAFIASVLDRQTLSPPDDLPPGAAGVRFGDRTTPYGSNVNMQQNLFRTWYLLSELTKDTRYAEAADAALVDFVTKAQSPVTHLMAWGEHLSYDMLADEVRATGKQYLIHEPKKPLIFWDRLYAAKPELLLNYATGLWEHQIYDKLTGQFSRHARWDIHRPSGQSMDFTKEAGHFIDIWGNAYAVTNDELYAHAIDVLTDRYHNRMNSRHLLDYDAERKDYCNNGHNLTFLCDIEDAADKVDGYQAGELTRKMQAFAAKLDEGFLAVPHRPDQPEAGFVATCTTGNGLPRDRNGPGPGGYSVLWGMGYGRQGTAMIALHAFRRARQLEQLPGRGEDARAYRELALQAAEGYAGTGAPDSEVDVWPVEFGTAILMHLEAHRLLGGDNHLREARRRAEEAVRMFWDEDSPLPRSSRLTDHYETITGAETMIYALFALHVVEKGLEIELPFSDIDR